jgi:outer membrane protein assembly factor BamB
MLRGVGLELHHATRRRGMRFALQVGSWSVAVLLLIASPTLAGDWPQFLGPQRNGTSDETGLIDAFPETGPEIVWSVDGGVGMSGIAVVDGTACTLIQRDGEQIVVALDAANGDTKWETPVAPLYENSMGDGPRATPTIAGGRAFVFTGEGILAALDMQSGDLLWSHDAPGDFGGQPADYGMACSPLIVDDLVVVTVGAPQATLAAYHQESGDLAWTYVADSAAGYSSPSLLKVSDVEQVVVFAGSSACGVSAAGDELWSYPFVTDYDCNIATPLLVDGRVFISSGENHGSALLAVPGTAGGDVQEAWTSFGVDSVLRNEWQTSILIDGHLYGFDNIGSAGPVTNLACVNAATGEQVWLERRFGKGNLIAADGKLWMTNMDGELIIARVTPEGYEELSRSLAMGSTRQAPALSDGRLFVRDDAVIMCIDVRAEP